MDYVYFEKKCVCISRDERANFSTGKPVPVSEYLKSIDIKTEEVFCIEDRYYVNSHSKLLKKLEEIGRDRRNKSNKSNLRAMEKQGLKILNNEMDWTLLIFSVSVVIILSVLPPWFIDKNALCLNPNTLGILMRDVARSIQPFLPIYGIDSLRFCLSFIRL